MKNMKEFDYELKEGEGKSIIFIHGWLGSKDFWKLITPYIQLKNPFLRYNQKCHAKSNKKYDIDILAEDLHQLIQKLDLEDPILVGHSMGGMTALKYATKYDNYSGLVLLATSASTPDPKNKSTKYFLEKFDKLDRKEWAEKITENYVGSNNQEIKEMTRKELQKAKEKPIIEGLKAMINYDVTDKFNNFEKPAIVVAGKKDQAITQNKSKEVATILKCDLKSLETTHQMLPEEPQKVANIISQFAKNEVK